jgi:hypothetical protein
MDPHELGLTIPRLQAAEFTLLVRYEGLNSLHLEQRKRVAAARRGPLHPPAQPRPLRRCRRPCCPRLLQPPRRRRKWRAGVGAAAGKGRRRGRGSGPRRGRERATARAAPSRRRPRYWPPQEKPWRGGWSWEELGSAAGFAELGSGLQSSALCAAVVTASGSQLS